ncbi:MAG: hypothetical protein IPJ21_13655 [Sterolibacteriaceae bacterium]|nr:hypothetical protein [Sterolibacteriaceae bacterium]MBK9084828.1 hypothetical protein [Sterolibacteriaceae bacterium]
MSGARLIALRRAKPRPIQAARLEAAWIGGLRAVIGVDRLSMRSLGMHHVTDLRRVGFRRFRGQSATVDETPLDVGMDGPVVAR